MESQEEKRRRKEKENMFMTYLILINFIAFVMFGVDKWKAVHEEYRLSERLLINTAVIGGSVGAIAGMLLFHHKTLHNKFRFGLPLILVVQLVLAVLVLMFFGQ